MKKFFILLLLSFLLFSCNKNNSENRGCDIQEDCNEELADMSGYELYEEETEYIFIKSNVKQMKEKIDNKDSFVIYFGFSRCPWCRDLMPILNQAGKDSGIENIYYVDTREKEEWKSNLDIDDYDLFVEMTDEYLRYDENNIKHLYTPMVFFIKDGNIIEVKEAPDYDAHDEKISDELSKELYDELSSAFKAIN